MKRALLLAVVLLAGCTNADDAIRTLKAAGYTDVQITGYRWFGCSKDDSVHTGFIAKGRDGSTVSGIVCGELFFKGNTIRTD
ncbi:hypothetical protein D3C86_1465080 [compost metagenome]